MRVSPSSSERIACRAERTAQRLAALRGFALLLLPLMAASCATVRPEQKEYLSEPSMTWSSGGAARAQEDHVLDNREGSNGGADAKGGGCGCN